MNRRLRPLLSPGEGIEDLMPELVWTTPKGRQEHELKAETRIGRGLGNDIQLPDFMASTFHATIACQDGAWIVEDNKSTNGTFVNGDRQQRAILHDGDVITIGDVSLTFNNAVRPQSSTIFIRENAAAETLAGGKAPAGARHTGDILDSVFRDDAELTQFKTSSLTVSADVAGQRVADAGVLERRLKVSYEISKGVAATLGLPEIMDRTLAALFEIFEAAERAFILLVDPDTGEVGSAAVRRRVPDDTEEISMSRTALRQAMDRREAILCMDALSDARYSDARSVVSLGIRSMMIAPLVFQNQVLGAIYMDTRHGAGRFSEPDLELITVAAGQVAGCVANARLHEQVVRSERLAAVGQTVAGLTHCIKNILQGITGGAYLVDKALAKGDMDRAFSGWDMVKRNNAFMEDLVFDLLSYSKERQPEYRATDLNELCEDVCKLAAARGDTKGVQVTFEPDRTLEPVEVDPTGIRRSVLNLAMNAVDACANKGGSVTVATESPRDGFVRVMVRDTGCGMSDETRAKLFTMFFSTKRSKGTGLGLPVSKKIVEEHGGRIEVASQEGEGTTFTVCLPPTQLQKGECDDGRREEDPDR